MGEFILICVILFGLPLWFIYTTLFGGFSNYKLENQELNNDILNLCHDIKYELSKLSLVEVFDYSLCLNIESEEKTSLTIRVYSSYGISQIGRQISLVNNDNWKLKNKVLKTRNNVFFEEDFFIFNNLKHNHMVTVLIHKGIKTHTIISNGFDKGKKFGREFKG